MIDPADRTRIVQQAYEDAVAFLSQPNVNSKRFCDPQTKAEEHARLPALNLFVANLTGATVVPFKKLPHPNFASWLFSVAPENMAIYLDQRQMVVWQQQTGATVQTQQIRSIAHELGHLRLAPRLQNGPLATFAPHATANEEENAWVYAMMFLALVLGDYCFSARQHPHNCDDTPKVQI
ncbi:MAG TPA: hypothetical protein VGF13_21750 [Verrucomicrobiae bacterium]